MAAGTVFVHFADKLDLRRDITFGARVKAAAWDGAAGEWVLTFEDGRTARCRFLITAIETSSSTGRPAMKNRSSFTRSSTSV